MSKFVIFALLLTFIACLTAMASAQPQRLTADAVIQKIIGQYDARYMGPSIVHPEETANLIDANNLNIRI